MNNYQAQHPEADFYTAQMNYQNDYLQRFLAQAKVQPLEGPSVLQLGGSDPQQLYEAARAVWEMTSRGECDYTAINLNCGCPSPKVAGKGCFGAALMDEPKLVAELTRAIHEGCRGGLPVTVKCRIGTDSNRAFSRQAEMVDDSEEAEYRDLCHFIETVARDGVVTDFGVHARIAVLRKSFSPADNRKIPPLKYPVVRRLVQEYPELTFTLNGGIETIQQAQTELAAAPGLKGIMIGRAWAAEPWSFAMTDQLLYGEDPVEPKNRLQILQEYGKHADAEEKRWDPVRIRRFIVKAIMPLFAGEPNAKKYRIALDDIAGLPKQLESQGKSMDGLPPISELIMHCATKHLSEEVLLRTAQESYGRVLWEQQKRRQKGGARSNSVMEWQSIRSEEASRVASS